MATVLYLSYDGMTDPLGQSQVLPYLKGLSEKGHNIILLTCEKKEKFDSGREEIDKIVVAAGIEWIPLKYTASPPIFSTIRDVLAIRRKSKKLCKQRQIDIVHCRSYISSIVGLHLKRKYGLKFVFDMRGFFADERVDGDLWNLKNPLFKIVFNYFKKKEKEFFSEADYTISLTHAGEKEIHSWGELSNQPVPIEVIPCCVDTDLFLQNSIIETNKNEWRKKLQIDENQKVISYLGSVGTWYMPDQMMQFFKRFLLKYPEARFLIVSQDDPAFIREFAIKNAVDINKIIIVSAKRKEVPFLLSLSDISLFFIKPVFSKKASSPTKQGEILSMGIPVVCNDNVGDTGKIIRDSGCGYVVNDFTIEEYDKAVEDVQRLLSIPSQKMRETAMQYFSLQKGIEAYNKIYKSIGY